MEIELQDHTASAQWFLNGQPIKEGEPFEFKNLGGGKHQLIINPVAMDHGGELECKSGELSTKCNLKVLKGETKPSIAGPDKYEAPVDKGQAFEFEVPYKSKLKCFKVIEYFNLKNSRL